MNKSFIQAAQELIKTSKKLPLLLRITEEKVDWFVNSISKSRPGLIRAMRPERKKNLAKFINALIMSLSLQHNGTICQINGEWVRPKTLEELAAQAGIPFYTAKRCLAFLKQLDFIESKQIKHKNSLGQLEVSPGLRALTPKFWKALGLWEFFQKSMEWAKKNCKRQFRMPFKTINIIKDTFKKAGNIAGKVVKIMADTARTNVKRLERDKKPSIINNDARAPKWLESWEKVADKRGIEKPLPNE